MERDETLENTYDNIMSSIGATVLISIIFYLSWVTEFLPRGIVVSMGLFFSLPLIFSFIFGIIFNNTNFSVRRKYGFGVYLLVVMILYFIIVPPTSPTDAFFLLLQAILGFLIVIITGILYLTPYRLLRRYSHRVRASVSFIISFILTYLIIFALKYWGVISWLN